MNFSIFNTATLSRGCHKSGEGTCALELLNLAVTGQHTDAPPECLTLMLSCLPPLNDGPWRNDEHRTTVILPYLLRLALCRRNPEIDQKLTYALADYAMRAIVPKARAVCGPIHCAVYAAMAKDAMAKDAMAKEAVAEAAETAAKAVAARAVAAKVRAVKAAVAPWAAAKMRAARASRAEVDSIERHTRAILEIICVEHGV